MEYANLILEIKNRVLYITINREHKLNALNKATLAELHTAFTNAYHDNRVSAIILTGAGQKSFVAGADISELVTLDAEQATDLSREGHTKVFDVIEQSPKPVIAAINGFALGGGLELALACHIRIASQTAKLGFPEVSLGIIPGYGGTQRLTQLVGKGRSFEMILSAGMISAQEALTIGLVNYVVSPEQLIATCEELLSKIMLQAPLAVAAAIRAINASGSETGFQTEIAEFGNCFDTDDVKEGIHAFLEKRPAKFSGK
ncbi:enoyl-CoA hydratase (plasmid) [Pedobacter sp. BS3]|uniref:enoyl-CoA hydratase/isomerase family protein n=1 Tax=Pedobacter sp. BS3 TaxID=2567937 RepID=UPI0011ED6973|nr:enoyl-CoA hydratase-related protein [Pedobacter sp. BS3]TZF85738.1 enoyl-CoA hydratase [Pedobacter sp. BS3]